MITIESAIIFTIMVITFYAIDFYYARKSRKETKRCQKSKVSKK